MRGGIMENIDQFIISILLLVFLLAIFFVLVILLVQNSNLRKEVQHSRSETLGFTQAQFTDLSMKNEQKLENIRFTLESRIHSIQEDQNTRLTEIREIVDEKLQKTLEDRIGQSFKMVSERLEQVYKGLGEMQTLAIGVGDLKKVLSNVKTRGILGEIQLGAILEQLFSKEQYRENVVTKPNSGERVEYAIVLPGDDHENVLLPVDAKFPQEPYIRLIEAYEGGNADEIDQSYKALERTIKVSAKAIYDKYIEPPYTTDFGILFLPVEGLYAEVVRRGLSEILQREYKVIIAGPTTMAALLNSLQMGFKTLAIQKHSGEVWNVLGAVKTEFDKFGSVLAQTQQRINQANAELDKLVGARTRSIQRKLSNISRLDKDLADIIFTIDDEFTSDEDELPIEEEERFL